MLFSQGKYVRSNKYWNIDLQSDEKMLIYHFLVFLEIFHNFGCGITSLFLFFQMTHKKFE